MADENFQKWITNGLGRAILWLRDHPWQPHADAIGVTIGDFSTTRVHGAFTLAYLVRNTIMNLTTQDSQVECFLNVARHLEPGGRFVIEVIVPPLRRLPRPAWWCAKTAFTVRVIPPARRAF